MLKRPPIKLLELCQIIKRPRVSNRKAEITFYLVKKYKKKTHSHYFESYVLSCPFLKTVK